MFWIDQVLLYQIYLVMKVLMSFQHWRPSFHWAFIERLIQSFTVSCLLAILRWSGLLVSILVPFKDVLSLRVVSNPICWIQETKLRQELLFCSVFLLLVKLSSKCLQPEALTVGLLLIQLISGTLSPTFLGLSCLAGITALVPRRDDQR